MTPVGLGRQIDDMDEVDVQASKLVGPSDAFLQCNSNGQQVFELYEEDVDEEQEHDLVPEGSEPVLTCASDQQMAMPQIHQ